MLIVTTETIPGRRSVVLGGVRGRGVQSWSWGRGGEITAYTEMLGEARQIASGRMAAEAEALGADAVVAMRYASSSVMQGAAECIAYGTAVKFID